MQKALIVSTTNSEPQFDLMNLNDYLSKGWTVVQMCPMTSSCSSTGGPGIHTSKIPPTCLVIIQKEGDCE